MLMVDWKDGREGVLTYDVVRYVQEVLLSHIQLVGLILCALNQKHPMKKMFV